MKKLKREGGFFLCLLMNLILNLEWTIPAWILLVLHFLLDWPVWLFWAALGLWLLVIVILTGVISFAAKCSTPTPQRENKNPYSVGAEKKLDQENEADS